MKGGKQFFGFLLCGGLAAIANICSRWFLSLWMTYVYAIGIAFLIGLATGYLLFKFFVFDARKTHKTTKEASRYVIVNALALLQTYAVSILLSEYCLPFFGIIKYRYDIAHIVGVGVPIVTSYFLHKNYTFQK